MPQWFLGFSEFPEFTEVNESSAPFRENPIAREVTKSNKFLRTEFVLRRHWIVCSATEKQKVLENLELPIVLGWSVPITIVEENILWIDWIVNRIIVCNVIATELAKI